MTKQEFLNEVAKYAMSDYARSKILPSLTIAQAILESGWGKSGLAVKSKNLFGIKAGSSWKGDKRSYPTKEFMGGKWITIDAFFREYPTFEGSVKDHNDLLQLPRYKKVKGETDYKIACQEIKNAGYATDPNYPKLLIGIIEKNKLENYDKQVLAPAKTAVSAANPVSQKYPLSKEDANTLIELVQSEYADATEKEKKEWHRIAQVLRQLSGQKK